MKTTRFLSFADVSATVHFVHRIWERTDGSITYRIEDKIRGTNVFQDDLDVLDAARVALTKSPETVTLS